MTQDQTIEDDFRFNIHTERWGHDDSYRIKRTQEGWEISNIANVI